MSKFRCNQCASEYFPTTQQTEKSLGGSTCFATRGCKGTLVEVPEELEPVLATLSFCRGCGSMLDPEQIEVGGCFNCNTSVAGAPPIRGEFSEIEAELMMKLFHGEV